MDAEGYEQQRASYRVRGNKIPFIGADGSVPSG
jgi:hypothetical protein